MPLGILTGLLRGAKGRMKQIIPGRRWKKASSLDILSSKRGPRNYYKGKNCAPTGRHTSKGKYHIMPERLPKYIVPDLTNFKLKAYVSWQTPNIKPKLEETGS